MSSTIVNEAATLMCIINLMFTKIAEPENIIELKDKIKNLLQTELGRNVFNQRYGCDFTYEELIRIIDGREYIWVSYSNKDNLVGFAELWVKSDGFFELGYIIFPEYQRLGFGYQLAKKVFEDSKDRLKIKKIKIEAENNNIGSMKILERLISEYRPTKMDANEKYTVPTVIYEWEFD